MREGDGKQPVAAYLHPLRRGNYSTDAPRAAPVFASAETEARMPYGLASTCGWPHEHVHGGRQVASVAAFFYHSRS
jgi:hypothetical protein